MNINPGRHLGMCPTGNDQSVANQTKDFLAERAILQGENILPPLKPGDINQIIQASLNTQG